jgi:hypothetical protein
MATNELERLRLGYTAAYAAYITYVRQISDAVRCGERPTETILRLEQAAFHDLVNAREALFDKLLRHGKAPKMSE